MTALQHPSLISIPDYLAGEEAGEIKHEYLGGTVHAMAGATNQHNSISLNCLLSLGNQLRGKPCRPFNSDTKVRIEFPDHTRFYYPDAMVVCQQNPSEDHFQDQPVVIVEVLSPSTRRADLGEKRDAYFTIPTLKVLLCVESTSPYVIVYRRSPGSGFVMEDYKGLDSVISLPEIETSLPLSEIYDRAEFSMG